MCGQLCAATCHAHSAPQSLRLTYCHRVWKHTVLRVFVVVGSGEEIGRASHGGAAEGIEESVRRRLAEFNFICEVTSVDRANAFETIEAQEAELTAAWRLATPDNAEALPKDCGTFEDHEDFFRQCVQTNALMKQHSSTAALIVCALPSALLNPKNSANVSRQLQLEKTMSLKQGGAFHDAMYSSYLDAISANIGDEGEEVPVLFVKGSKKVITAYA